jgi:hypothetical protein
MDIDRWKTCKRTFEYDEHGFLSGAGAWSSPAGWGRRIESLEYWNSSYSVWNVYIGPFVAVWGENFNIDPTPTGTTTSLAPLNSGS